MARKALRFASERSRRAYGPKHTFGIENLLLPCAPCCVSQLGAFGWLVGWRLLAGNAPRHVDHEQFVQAQCETRSSGHCATGRAGEEDKATPATPGPPAGVHFLFAQEGPPTDQCAAGATRLVGLSTGKMLDGALTGHRAAVTAPAFNPDAPLASDDMGGHIAFWDDPVNACR
ncbi:WD40 repeat domain-containing protein [Variovorax rhizosphaerae]|uniref:WD40 repeat domain-containing protein n=1 Tax=Variovorax rhizosphaerae TaxID=1836200 RepID=A0ABU8WLF1_9BURK